MLGFLYFIIYYLTPHVSRKHVTSYLCYPSTPPNTHFLNFVNMIVTVNRTYVWQHLGVLIYCFIIQLFMIKYMLGDILFELTLMSYDSA